MIKLTLENVVDAIVDLVPEFKKYKDFNLWDINDPIERTGLLDIFGRFLKERIEIYPNNDPLIQRVYKFLNEQFNESESDKDMVGYLGQEIFENVASSKKGMELSRKLLKGKALETFNAIAEYFGYDSSREIIGDGGAADILRHELKTGEKIGGASYKIKIQESIKGLEKLLQDQSLTQGDRSKAEWLLNDLKDALKGGRIK